MGCVVECDGINSRSKLPQSGVCELQEAIILLASAVSCVVIGTWLIGEVSPKDSYLAPEMKHGVQRSAVRWLSMLAASVIGAYKLHDVIDLIITAIR